MTTHHHPPGITAEVQLLRGTILLGPLRAVVTVTTGCVGLRQPNTTRGHTIQITTVQPLTRRVGTLLNLLITTRMTAEGLPLRGVRLTLSLTMVVVALHHRVVGMTLIAYLLGKTSPHLITPSPKSPKYFPGDCPPRPMPPMSYDYSPSRMNTSNGPPNPRYRYVDSPGFGPIANIP